MSQRRSQQPRQWSTEELEEDRQTALAAFVKERGKEGTQAYTKAFEETELEVRRLFALTSDLRRFRGGVFEGDQELIKAARYLAGPPISADDLRTLVGESLGRRELDPKLAARIADVLRSAWDPIRFPWLRAKRPPKKHELESAIKWTASIWAVEMVRTRRRTESSRRQEEAVARALRNTGFEEGARHRRINALDELPRGTFSREVNLASSKCDVPVRLRDGRLLALECKVSNSAVNSIKRLLRETGGKSRAWRNTFGLQAITGAVLAGVYTLGNLVQAQEDHDIAIFWEHNLTALQEFVSEAE